jgi:cell division protein FtsI/penicillin-binding protein 2
MLVTPLQLASTYCAFVNSGSIPNPHIVDSICEVNSNDYIALSETNTSYWRENVINKNINNTLLPMMKDIMSSDYNGTGQKLRVRNCVVAGKTGTAQIGGDDSHEISWIVAFRTGVEEKDERLVLVMLEIPNDTAYSEFKFIIARELLEMKDSA